MQIDGLEIDATILKLAWKQDSEINEVKLGYASLETPRLHSKYLGHLMEVKFKQSEYKNILNVAKKLKTKYYNGQLTKDELAEHGWEQYQYNKPLKSEIEDILNGDSDIIEIKKTLDYLDVLAYSLESILGQIKSRDFQIKNNIQYQQFISGG